MAKTRPITLSVSLQRARRLADIAETCRQREIPWKEFRRGIIPDGTTWKTLTDEQIDQLEVKLDKFLGDF
jgi:hypothetical protein